MWHRRPRGGAGSEALRSAPLRSGRPPFPRICSWSPSSHSLNPGDRSLQPGRGGADRKDAIRASAMEAPALSLTEEDLTEVKKDVSSSAGLGAAGRAGDGGKRKPGAERRGTSDRKNTRSGHTAQPACCISGLAESDLAASCESTGKPIGAGLGVSLPSASHRWLCTLAPY